jgi:hypothetical protein|tara:strand:+ start:261 stop:425 length:165 start_codon:yes stop_codon:yes gene_type:complete
MKTVTFNIQITLSNKNWIDNTAATNLAHELSSTIKKIAQPTKVIVTWRKENEEA